MRHRLRDIAGVLMLVCLMALIVGLLARVAQAEVRNPVDVSGIESDLAAHEAATGDAAHAGMFNGANQTNLTLFAGDGSTGAVTATGADAALFLRGDGTWAAAGGGGSASTNVIGFMKYLTNATSIAHNTYVTVPWSTSAETRWDTASRFSPSAHSYMFPLTGQWDVVVFIKLTSTAVDASGIGALKHVRNSGATTNSYSFVEEFAENAGNGMTVPCYLPLNIMATNDYILTTIYQDGGATETLVIGGTWFSATWKGHIP